MASQLRDTSVSAGRRVDVTHLIDNSAFNSFTLSVAVICFLAIVFDGLDVSLFGTVLPALMADMRMGPAEAGILASIGHVGAVGGAIVFGVAADAIGRKRMLLIGVTLFTTFTAACGLAQGFVDFAIYRFIAGFGLAGIVPIAVALVFEYTPGKRKAVVSSACYMGITVGVLLSALLAIAFLPSHGWRAILLGTFVCILLVPAAMLWLPESMPTLVKRGKHDTIRGILAKVDPGHAARADDDYVLTEAPAAKVPLRRMFQGEHLRNTLCLGIAMLCLMMIAVTLTTWVAQLMVLRGFTLTTGITFILVFSLSNFIATPLAGWMSDRMGYKRVFAIYMPLLFVSISLIGVAPDATAALACMFFAGFACMGATCVLLPYAGSLYPMSFRSSAMGVIYAIGRVGPIVGPAVAGGMLAAKLGVGVILVCVAAPSIVALVAFLLVKELPARQR
ncbi:MFS transporter, AAHS family, benzoate transport protein [Duganella sp. CF517]|uniref:MFS transporter n=1 Tax=Duganella sp. CF517 TaxID=1881038 RepID=UPI0008D5F8CD|nr:MFS transporter [Duganella sp. CF517]SEO08905.1 MFS transporter, AAHS family, benzoate transport protein [Duganella sp. CF517]